ncbi:hypothetical protein [Indioceanicola profundi]|uniref:hypothetical protein n=1 Tax=Indioceanicola profundi TaxID=2220096 RepID=UPI000E6AC0D1|nr:hypothetical protein [Indioceanicola profundi]
MEGASRLGTGAERPGAVSAGFPRTVAHTGPAPEAETGRYHETTRPAAAAPRPDVTTPNMAANPTPSYDRAGATSTGSTTAAASNTAAASTGIGGTRWMTWGLIALAVLVLLWIVF